MKKTIVLLAGVLLCVMMSGSFAAAMQETEDGGGMNDPGKAAVQDAAVTAPQPGSVYEDNGRGIAVALSEEEEESDEFSSDPYVPDERRGEKTVIGYDDRTTIYDTYSYPYSAIAYICGDCPYGDGAAGTGFMISENVMLTAAHCLYCREHNCFLNLRFYFGYGQNGSYSYDYTGHYTYWYPNNYPFGADYTSEHEKWDHAYIRFDDRNVGDTTGWLGFSSMSDDTFSGIYSLEMTGYRNGVMKTGGGSLLDYNGYTFKYDLDTEPGNSGSPIFYNGGVTAIGINISYNDTWNTANRISNEMLHNMEANGVMQITWNRSAPDMEDMQKDRHYELVASECGWDEAKASALEMGGRLASPDTEAKKQELASFLAAYPDVGSVWVSGTGEEEMSLAWDCASGEIRRGSGEQMPYVVEYD